MTRPPRDGERSPAPEKQAVKTTIVGGQPSGKNRPIARIPVGIEQLLAMASVNDEFAAALLAKRDAAIAASGAELTATERAILGAIDDASLRRMVANIGGGVPDRDRRAFMTRSAAALLVLAGGMVPASACGDDDKSDPGPGSAPGAAPGSAPAATPTPKPPPSDAAVPDAAPAKPPDAMPKHRPGASRGIRPDRPGSGEAGPTKPSEDTTTGVRPDRPIKNPTRGIRPDRPDDL